MIEVETTVDGDPYADVADLLAMPSYLGDVFDEQDLAELVVAGRISGDRLNDLLAGMGWDDLDCPADPDDRDGPDGFASRDPFTPIGDLDEDGLLEELHAAHRATGASQARRARLITELTRRRAAAAVTELTGRHAREPQPLSMEARAVIEEVRLELCLGVRDAGNLTDTALGLCTQAPDTLDALFRGDIDLDRAETILQLRQSLVLAQADTNAEAPADEQVDPEQLGKDLEDELLKKAPRRTRAQLRRAGEKAQISANPKAAEYRHRVKRARRNVTYTPTADSMCRLSAYLPADQGIQVKNALTQLAYHARNTRRSGDPRTLDQLRVDALVDTLTRAAAALQDDGESGETTSAGEAFRPGRGTGDTRRGGSAQDLDDPQARQPVSEEGRIPDEADEADDIDTTTSKEDGSSLQYGRSDQGTTSGSGETSSNASTSRSGRKANSNNRKQSREPRILVTISASTLAGDDENPGYLQGHGPIIASMARDVAATGTWRCAITDTTHGTLLGLGSSTYTPKYRPTQRLRRHLLIRDRICRIPGCNTPAELCDIDHCTSWPDGATCECCTECLCGNHHRMKHETGFTLTLSTNPNDPPGTLIWTTPGRREYLSHPAVLQDPDPSRAGP